jgi:hypothetical protein
MIFRSKFCESFLEKGVCDVEGGPLMCPDAHNQDELRLHKKKIDEERKSKSPEVRKSGFISSETKDRVNNYLSVIRRPSA